MESPQQLLKKGTMPENILALLFIVFLVMGQSIPRELSNLISTPVGTIAVIVVSLSLFAYSNPVLAVLGVFVAFEMLRRSGSFILDNHMNTEAKKWKNVENVNQVPYTLEQEVIKNMAPIVSRHSMSPEPSFKPIVNSVHDAEMLY
jgi:hypothetical protein